MNRLKNPYRATPPGSPSPPVPLRSVCRPSPGIQVTHPRVLTLNWTGSEVNHAHSAWPAVSADGRWITFHSWNGSLISGVSGTQVYLYDVLTQNISVVSTSSVGDVSDSVATEDSVSSVSCDGEFVVFVSNAGNLTTGSAGGFQQVYVKNTKTGMVELISKRPTGEVGNHHSGAHSWDNVPPRISADGRHVLFWSLTSNLVPGTVAGVASLLLKDRKTGQLELISSLSDGTPLTDRWVTGYAAQMSEDAKRVFFASSSGIPDAFSPGGRHQVYMKDRESGKLHMISRANDGTPGNDHSRGVAISGDGRFVYFASRASNLIGGFTPKHDTAVYRYRVAGRSIEFIAYADDIDRAMGVSYDGDVISYRARRNGPEEFSYLQTLVKKVSTQESRVVSVGADGKPLPAHQEMSALSPDGKWIVWMGSDVNRTNLNSEEPKWQIYQSPTGF